MNHNVSTIEKEEVKKSTIREYAESIIIAFILALVIRTFVIQAFKIPSGSMENTLLIGDHILVSKFIYGTAIPFTEKKIFPVTTPKRGDIIVFKYPKDEKKDYIKRIIGLPGDKIRIIDKQVFINGKAHDDKQYTKYVDSNIFSRSFEHVKKRVKRDQMDEIRVPENSYFVMGDNRDNSEDSRFWGFVPENKIRGKAFIVYFSWNSNDHSLLPWGWIRFNRIGRFIK